MGNLIMSFLMSHQDYIIGIAVGYALANIPQMVGIVFNAAMKVPFLRAAVLKNPEGIKKAIDEVEQAIDKEIDEEVELEKKAAKPVTPSEK